MACKEDFRVGPNLLWSFMKDIDGQVDVISVWHLIENGIEKFIMVYVYGKESGMAFMMAPFGPNGDLNGRLFKRRLT